MKQEPVPWFTACGTGAVPWLNGTAYGLPARRGWSAFGRAGQDVSPGKTRQKTPEPIALMLYGCEAFVHRRQTLASHPKSIMALVSCIFLRQWSCPGIHPAPHARRLTSPGGRADRELLH